jgi:hypothetical protein
MSLFGVGIKPKKDDKGNRITSKTVQIRSSKSINTSKKQSGKGIAAPFPLCQQPPASSFFSKKIK